MGSEQAFFPLQTLLNGVIILFKPVLMVSCSRAKDALTATIPIARFGGKVFAHWANSIAVSKGTLDDGIKSYSNAKKSDQSCRKGVDTAIGF